MKAPSNEESKSVKNDNGVLGNDSSFDNNYWSSTNSLYNQNLQGNSLDLNNYQRLQQTLSSHNYMKNNSFSANNQSIQGNTPKGNNLTNQFNNEFPFYSNPNKVLTNTELSNFSNVSNLPSQSNLNNGSLQLNKTLSNTSGPYLGSKYLYNNDSFKFPLSKKEPTDKSITFSLSEKGINKIKKSKMLGILSCNSGICEASTQTDLTMKDISNLEYINKIYKESSFKDTSSLNPHTISKFNSTIYPDISKEMKKTKVGKNMYFEKKIRKKTGDITIYNNLVVNNERSSVDKNSNNIINIFCENEEGLDIFGSNNDEKLLNSDNIINTNFSFKTKNNLSINSNSFLKINDEIINKSKNQGLITKKETHFHPHLKNKNVTDHLQRIHKKIKPDKSKDIDTGNKEESNNKEREILNSSLNLNEDKKLDDSMSQKSQSQSQKNGSKPKNLKKKYDPFSFFLMELKDSNKEWTEDELEKNGKEQWASMNKEMKKVYNLHADTEKRNQKKLKRKQNQSLNNKINQEEAQISQLT